MKTTKIDHAMIGKAYSLLSRVFYAEPTNYAEQIFEACRDEEKRHRGFGDNWTAHHPNGCTLAEAARLFAVKRVAEYLAGDRMPRGKNYLHMQPTRAQIEASDEALWFCCAVVINL